MAMRRRDLLAGTAILGLRTMKGRTALISGGLRGAPDGGSPPVPVRPGPWHYFTSDEGLAVEALADRIIPPDPRTPGGKDAGCALFIDRQLAGPYGRAGGDLSQGAGCARSILPVDLPGQAFSRPVRRAEGRTAQEYRGRKDKT